MKLTIERERLLRPLSNVTSVVEKRQTLPILGNVFLKHENGSLSLIGTDLETEVMTRIDNVAGDSGECTVTAKKFYDICRMLPDDSNIEINNLGDRTTIKAGRSRFTLHSLPAADFPTLEADQWEQNLEVEQAQLKKLLEQTAFSMAQQDVRYYLNGCLLEIDGEIMKVVATDGHRLATCEAPLKLDSQEKRQVIIPRKGILELMRFLEDEGTAGLQINPNHVRVTAGPLVFTTKLIDGRFPDYTKVIPKASAVHLMINRVALHESLARTAVLTNEKFRGVRLMLKPGLMTVMANNPEQEEAVDEIAVDYQGDGVEIGFNVGYLMDALRALSSEEVDLGLQDPNSGCTMHVPKDTSTMYVVMPMKI